MEKRGAKQKIDRESFLKAVEKIRSIDDKLLSEELGVGKSTVWRYKRDNPEVVKEAEEILEKYQEKAHVSNISDRKTFRQIPIIQEWDDLLTRKIRSPSYKNRMINGLYHVCNYLKVHPQNLTLKQATDLNQEMKELYLADEKQPKGLAYTTIRESIRSFFMTAHQ